MHAASTPSALRLLTVDASENDAARWRDQLQTAGYDCPGEHVGAPQLADALARQGWDLVLCDGDRPLPEVLATLRLIRSGNQRPPVIVLCREPSAEVAVSVIKAGASDYLRSGDACWLASVERELQGSARTDTEQALRDAQYRDLVEMSHDMIWSLDAEGRCTFVSPSVTGILGYGPDEVIGRPFSEFTNPAQHERILQNIDHLDDGKAGFGYEAELIRKDGRVVVVRANVVIEQDGDGNVVRMTGSSVDITARKQAEAARRASEAKYRELVEKINEVVFAVDDRGVVTYMNPAVLPLTGYTPEETLGRPFSDFVHPEDLPPLLESFAGTLAGLHEPQECRVLTKTGEVRWVRSFSRAVVEGDQDIGVYGVVSDITESKHAAEQVRRQLAELAHMLRLNTMGEMAAQLAHEINQPLGAIANFAKGLAARYRQGTVDPDSMRAAADEIAAQALRAGEIIRRLRTFVRKGETRRDACDLNGLVREAAHLVEPEARGQGIPVRIVLHPEEIRVEVDRIQVQQVLVNLLRNAIESMVERNGKAHELLISTSESLDSTAQVSVRDTGAGLPVGAETRIFDPFYTTKSDGLGMGLSISRSIIEAESGRLWAERNLDSGTTFHFTLPLDGQHDSTRPHLAAEHAVNPSS